MEEFLTKYSKVMKKGIKIVKILYNNYYKKAGFDKDEFIRDVMTQMD